MRRFLKRCAPAVAAIPFLAVCGAAQNRGCVIQENAVGPVHAGMTIAQARQAMRGSILKPTEDADRRPMFAVVREGLHTMDLYVTPGPPADSSKVERIRVFDGACSTQDGVHPGMRLSDAAQKYGRVTRLITMDTESREYAEFERQPPWLDIQVGNGQEGIYPTRKRCTANYVPSAHIASIWVARPGANGIPRDDSACNAALR